MRHMRLSLFSILIGTSLVSHTAFAAAYQLYELGTPIIGTAAVGQAANIHDASTAYLNPAGMGFLPGTEYMLGAQMILPYINFSKNSSNTITGDNGGNAAMLTPGLDMFFAYDYSPCLRFGFSVATPYGGALNYDNGWVGRYVVQNALFYAINLNPSMSYRFNDWLSIGGGVSLEYMNLSQTTALPIDRLTDGQISVKVDDFAPGFNLGVMFMPYQSTKIGIAYRSKITHDLKGDLTFLRINNQPNVTTTMVMPHNIIASLEQDFSNQFTLLAELGWANWSAVKNTILQVDSVSAVTPRDWNNTYRAGIGGRYNATPCLTLQAGISYDSSPTDSSHRLPDLPMDRQIRVGVGALYAMSRAIDLGFSYEYWNLGAADISNTSSNGVLAGSYSRNYSNVVQLSINVQA